MPTGSDEVFEHVCLDENTMTQTTEDLKSETSRKRKGLDQIFSLFNVAIENSLLPASSFGLHNSLRLHCGPLSGLCTPWEQGQSHLSWYRRCLHQAVCQHGFVDWMARKKKRSKRRTEGRKEGLGDEMFLSDMIKTLETKF